MPNNLTIISIGSRGVGKTVFLASNCANFLQSQSKGKNQSHRQWFECQDKGTQEKIDKLLNYVARNKQYPPATFKITNFSLSLKRKNWGGVKTLCHLDWLDIPGEWCNLENEEFQAALLGSHGCCVFVDAFALLHDATYPKSLERIIKQLEAITALIDRNNLTKYPIALICTKNDLIKSNSINFIQLEEKLIPLVKLITSSKAVYQQFYSAIPLFNPKSGRFLEMKDVNAPLLWITAELRKTHHAQKAQNLGLSLESILSNKGLSSKLDNSDRLNFNLSSPKNIILITLASCSLVAIIATLSLILGPRIKLATLSRTEEAIQNFNDVLKSDANNPQAIAGIVDVYVKLGQPEKAIANLEMLLAKHPENLNILTELVDLYRLTGQVSKQEQTYDKILAIDKKSFFALLGKAELKISIGEKDEAKKLYKTAETYASSPWAKTVIKDLASKNLDIQ